MGNVAPGAGPRPRPRPRLRAPARAGPHARGDAPHFDDTGGNAKLAWSWPGPGKNVFEGQALRHVEIEGADATPAGVRDSMATRHWT